MRPAPLRQSDLWVFFKGHPESLTASFTCACAAGNDCADGFSRISGSADDDYLDVRLKHPVRDNDAKPEDFDRTTEVQSRRCCLALIRRSRPFRNGCRLGGKPIAGRAAKLRFSADYIAPLEVYHDALGSVFQLPGTIPYVQAAGCMLSTSTRDEVEADCAAPSRMVRRELFYPGWAVFLNGTKTQLKANGLFQGVALPRGRSVVRFSFEPAHTKLSFVLWGISILLLLTAVVGSINPNAFIWPYSKGVGGSAQC